MVAQRSERSHWGEGACGRERGACEDKGARELGDAPLISYLSLTLIGWQQAACEEAPVGTRALFTSHLPSNFTTLTCFIS
jgi:hypothetical protein